MLWGTTGEPFTQPIHLCSRGVKEEQKIRKQQRDKQQREAENACARALASKGVSRHAINFWIPAITGAIVQGRREVDSYTCAIESDRHLYVAELRKTLEKWGPYRVHLAFRGGAPCRLCVVVRW